MAILKSALFFQRKTIIGGLLDMYFFKFTANKKLYKPKKCKTDANF